jgi:hypothetical protein
MPLGNTKKVALVLTLGVGQSGQLEAKMPKRILLLSQDAKKNVNFKPKCSTIF